MAATLLEAAPPATFVEPSSDELPTNQVVQKLSLTRRAFHDVGWLTVRGIGLVMLLVGLAILSTLPLLQFAVLGYLLEAARRASLPGGLRRELPGVAEASHVGLGVLASLIFLLPVWILADRAFAASLLSPGTAIEAEAIRTFKIVRFLVVVHLIVAWLKGGRLRDFLQPWASAWWIVKAIFKPRIVAEHVTRTFNAVDSEGFLRLWWLGVRGYVGSLLWLAPGALCLAAGRNHPLVGILGAVLLLIAVYHLPFLQIHFARTGRLSAFLERREVRRLVRNAPVMRLLATLFAVALALPLYAFKIEPLPAGLWWLAALFFVGLMAPAKIFAGLAMGIADRRTKPAWLLLRISCWLLMIPVGLIYVGVLFLTPYVEFNGMLGVLFEQHAFLLPAPLGPIQ
jgi:hypothetical protein